MSAEPSATEDVSEQTRIAAERLGVLPLALQVVAVEDLGRSYRRIRLGGSRVAELNHRPGQDLTFTVPADPPVRRRYSIRRTDRASGLVDIEVVCHGDGPGSRWAAAARPGDRVEAVGPRGKIFVDADASVHVFVGDESYLPAASAMVESLTSRDRAVMVIDCDPPIDLPILTDARFDGPLWVHRNVGGTSAAALIDAVETLDLAGPDVHVYAGGERLAVQAVREAVLASGLAGDRVDAKAYWRADRPNAERGEPDKD
jgi:NADPH-dependent ferric siderophore reductase